MYPLIELARRKLSDNFCLLRPTTKDNGNLHGPTVDVYWHCEKGKRQTANFSSLHLLQQINCHLFKLYRGPNQTANKRKRLPPLNFLLQGYLFD